MLPERLFVIVIVPEGGRDTDRMPLLNRRDAAGRRLTPVFSSMRLATTFLSQGQLLGFSVNLDYIFPADGARFTEDFPEYVEQLDPSAESFFVESPGS